MVNKGFNKEKLIKYWIDGSDDDFETMMLCLIQKDIIGHYL